MSTSILFFDETADVLSRVIQRLRNSPAAASEVKKYLETVARISEILAQIHDQVAESAVYASYADSIDEAKTSLEKVRQVQLKGTLKAQDLCGELRYLGSELRPLSTSSQMSVEDKSIWEEFCSNLEQGEGDTAQLYDEKLYELTTLPFNEPSLDALKAKVKDISEQLVSQKARFDLLAKQSTAMSKRL